MGKNYDMQAVTKLLHQRCEGSEKLILRRSSIQGRRFFQLHGEYLGVRYSRTVKCSGEFDLLEKAAELFQSIASGSADTRRPGLTTRLKSLHREADDHIERERVRELTKNYKRRHLNRCVDYLQNEWNGQINQRTLLKFIEETSPDPESRTRRGATDAVRLIAKKAKLELEIPPDLRFKAKAPKKRDDYTDEQIIDALTDLQPKLSDFAIQALAFTAATGQRGTFFFSIDEPETTPEIGSPLRGFDTKRKRPGEATLSLDIWDQFIGPKLCWTWRQHHFDYRDGENLDDQQLIRIHAINSDVLHQVRRKATPEQSKILQFRALRACTCRRLIVAGVDPYYVATSLNTSIEMINRTYSSPMGSLATQEIKKRLGS